MKNLKLFICAASALLVISSCSKKDEAIPTEPKVEMAKAYYFTGNVVDGATGLSGVDVTVNGEKKATTDPKGIYVIALDKNQPCTLSFAKNGYVTQTVIRDMTSLQEQQSMVVNIAMTQMTPPVKSTGEAQTVSNTTVVGNTTLAADINLPKGAVAKGVDIYVTPYAPATDHGVTSLFGLDLQPSALTVTGAKVFIEGTLPGGISYNNLKVVNESASKGNDPVLTYDANTNKYTMSISTFGNYVINTEIPVQYDSPVTSTAIFESKAVDQACGANQPVEYTQIVKERTGYVYVKPVVELVKQAFPELSSADQATIANSITAKMISTLGSDEGVKTMDINKGVVTIAPNTMYQYQSNAVDRIITYNFSFKNRSGLTVAIPVKVKQAMGVVSKVIATSCNDHSGGGTN